MKILVDEMPSSPLVCDYRKLLRDGATTKNGCYIARSDTMECKVGEDPNFVCPFFRAFKATTQPPPVPIEMVGQVKSRGIPILLLDENDDE